MQLQVYDVNNLDDVDDKKPRGNGTLIDASSNIDVPRLLPIAGSFEHLEDIAPPSPSAEKQIQVAMFMSSLLENRTRTGREVETRR